MISAIFLSVALLGADQPPAAAAPQPALEAYREAVARTAKNADAQVHLALWCEAHGLTAERMKHLSLAVLYEPKNALARGLMGLVAYQGKWQRPEQVSQEVQDNAQQKVCIKEYLDRRFEAPDRAEDQWKLAIWCEQNGLREQASAHLYRVVQLDPKRETAWKHLGFKHVGARWVKPDEAAAAKADAQRQKKANDHWRPVLERLRSSLQSKDASRRAEAEKALAQITDWRAVPMVWTTFARGQASLQKMAVQVLGQIDDASASRSLAMLAVFGRSADVRRKAIETLRRRDTREFAGLLIAIIKKPVKYTVKPVGGPGQPGELFIFGQGSTPNLRRVYSPPAVPSMPLRPGDQVVMDANGLPAVNRQDAFSQTMSFNASDVMGNARNAKNSGVPEAMVESMLSRSGVGNQRQDAILSMMNAYGKELISENPLLTLVSMIGGPYWNKHYPVNNTTYFDFNVSQSVSIPVGRITLEAQITATAAQQQLESDADSIKQYNASLDQINDRVLPVLQDISGRDTGPDPVVWLKWFNNMVGFNSLQASEPPTVTENVPLVYQPQPIPLDYLNSSVTGFRRVSCFAAGTLVHTLTGSQRIESLELGDQVLAQSIKTGALAYKPILVVHHNPPSKTFEIKLGNETIVSSHFHRFWKAGSGWVMARDLKVGDPIRTLNGTVKVTAIKDGKVVPVFNLEVADAADFFVGEIGALAHDNTVPDLRETPFDSVTAAVHSDDSSRNRSPREGKP